MKPQAWFAPLFLFAAVVGCSAEYKAERLYWQAERAALAASKDPVNATAEQVAKAIKGFERVIDKAPGTVPAARAQFAIGSVYLIRREYAKARRAYDQVVRNYWQFNELAFGARLAIAKSFEAEQNQLAMVAAYRDVAEQHPWTAQGLEAPLAIARSLAGRGMTEEAADAYQYAITHYQHLTDNAPTAELASRAKGQLIVVYQQLKEWGKALKLLDELAQTGKGINRPMILLAVATIHETRLNQKQQSKALYEQLVKEYPQDPAGKAAAERLKQLAETTPAS